MHFQHSDWFTQSRLLAHIPQFDLIWKTATTTTTKFPSDKAAEKIRFRKLSTEETTGKKKLKKKMSCHTGSDKKTHKLWFEIN